MKVKCFAHNSSLLGVLNFHYCFCTIFFSFFFLQSILAKITGFDSCKNKTYLPKGEKKNLTSKKLATLEKYVVKIRSRHLRHRKEGASLCDRYFL